MILEKFISDHSSILLLEHVVDYGPILFRVFHSWLDMDGFDMVVHDSWSQAHARTVFHRPWVKFKKKL